MDGPFFMGCQPWRAVTWGKRNGWMNVSRQSGAFRSDGLLSARITGVVCLRVFMVKGHWTEINSLIVSLPYIIENFWGSFSPTSQARCAEKSPLDPWPWKVKAITALTCWAMDCSQPLKVCCGISPQGINNRSWSAHRCVLGLSWLRLGCSVLSTEAWLSWAYLTFCSSKNLRAVHLTWHVSSS